MSKDKARCQCGGQMVKGTKFDSLAGEDRVWWVCPFCNSTRPTAAEQSHEFRDEVLTQPTRD